MRSRRTRIVLRGLLSVSASGLPGISDVEYEQSCILYVDGGNFYGGKRLKAVRLCSVAMIRIYGLQNRS